jgi:predicted DCC family thiol-disulfide oxidoreductase YuxK
MKTKNKTLVYDDACPMCAWYSDAFVKAGMLEKEGRKAFSTASPELLNDINVQRSKNEIPLVDNETGQVWYGIDALLEILGDKIPVIKTIGKLKPVNWFLKRFYKFISFNRKVIVASLKKPDAIDCTPDFNAFYRVLFMVVFLTFNTLMLFPIHYCLARVMPSYHLTVGQMHFTHAIFVLSNCVLATSLVKREAIEYLGQVNMLALVTILLLIPFMLVNKALGGSTSFSYIYLGALTFFIIYEYFRRMEYVSFIYRHKWIMIANLFCVIAFMLYLFII